MSSVLKNTLSRWGHSKYETDLSVKKEKRVLSKFVDVLADYTDAEIIVIHSKQPFGDNEYLKCPSLQLLVTTTSGLDHIDISYLSTKGVRIVRMPKVRRDAVVETTLGLLINASRLIWKFHRDAKTNLWGRDKLDSYAPKRLQDLKVGIVGCGVIGRRMISVLEAFGVQLYAVDPLGVPSNVEEMAFNKMGRECDAVLLLCDLNPSSEYLANADWLSKTKRGMILINCARGRLVDIDAAIGAIRAQHLGFLGLDVFPEEPYTKLDIVNEFENIRLLPHASGFHPNLSKQIMDGLREIILCYQQRKVIYGELRDTRIFPEYNRWLHRQKDPEEDQTWRTCYNLLKGKYQDQKTAMEIIAEKDLYDALVSLLVIDRKGYQITKRFRSENDLSLQFLILKMAHEVPSGHSLQKLLSDRGFVRRILDSGEKDWDRLDSDSKLWIFQHLSSTVDLDSLQGQVGAQIDTDWANPDEHPAYMARVESLQVLCYPVTQMLYAYYVGSNPSLRENLFAPVTQVSWVEALHFANRMSLADNLEVAYKMRNQEGKFQVKWNKESNGWRLPTETEWEIIARSGKKYTYSGSKQVDDVGWYMGNSTGAKSVGQLLPNSFGLYDMSGNVWEWCWDWYAEYQNSNEVLFNPVGAAKGTERVVRGGSYKMNKRNLRVSGRQKASPKLRANDIGFRLVRPIKLGDVLE
jgi:formylglycine-generating enzyme